MVEDPLAAIISDFVLNTPAEIIQELLDDIRDWEGIPSDYQKAKLLSSIPNPHVQSRLIKLMDCWENNYPELSSESIFLSLQSCLRTLRFSELPAIELIWTGPEKYSGNFRRTDQALLELINSAKEHLLIVSFAVYKAKPIIQSIESAIQRNVRVVLCLEDSTEQQGKLNVSGLKSFSASVFKIADFYTWPIENRPLSLDGRRGSLHAKLAVADRRKAFITSANLTDYAMDLNMEMGVMIEDSRIG